MLKIIKSIYFPCLKQKRNVEIRFFIVNYDKDFQSIDFDEEVPGGVIVTLQGEDDHASGDSISNAIHMLSMIIC